MKKGIKKLKTNIDTMLGKTTTTTGLDGKKTTIKTPLSQLGKGKVKKMHILEQKKCGITIQRLLQIVKKLWKGKGFCYGGNYIRIGQTVRKK